MRLLSSASVQSFRQVRRSQRTASWSVWAPGQSGDSGVCRSWRWTQQHLQHYKVPVTSRHWAGKGRGYCTWKSSHDNIFAPKISQLSIQLPSSTLNAVINLAMNLLILISFNYIAYLKPSGRLFFCHTYIFF